MENYIINTGTITYGIRARDTLRKNGYKADLIKIKGKKAVGCGYAVTIKGEINKIENILKISGVKYISITAGEK